MGIDINIRVTGGAGQGVHTAGGLLCRLAVASGHHFHATQDYMSRIRGGRNSYSVRVREIPVGAGRPLADIVLSLDPGSLPHILSSVDPAGIVVCDLPTGAEGSADPRVIAAPLKELAVAAGSPILENIVGAGIVARVLGTAAARAGDISGGGARSAAIAALHAPLTGLRRPFRAASSSLRASSSRRSSDFRRSSWTPKKPIPAMQTTIPPR